MIPLARFAWGGHSRDSGDAVSHINNAHMQVGVAGNWRLRKRVECNQRQWGKRPCPAPKTGL